MSESKRIKLKSRRLPLWLQMQVWVGSMLYHGETPLGHPLRHWENEPDVMLVDSGPEQYSIKFTHPDLRPKKIYASKTVTSHQSIGWEFSGWHPEYWDYTKMHWTHSPLWDKFYQAVEQEVDIAKYPEELAAETAVWKLMYLYFYDCPRWNENDDFANVRHCDE